MKISAPAATSPSLPPPILTKNYRRWSMLL
jgi:hypothetical protein